MVKKVFAALLLVFLCSSVVLGSKPRARDCGPQVLEVDDPLEAPLSGMALWGKLEDPDLYLQAAESACLSVILTRAPSGDWLWIPSWDSVEENKLLWQSSKKLDLKYLGRYRVLTVSRTLTEVLFREIFDWFPNLGEGFVLGFNLASTPLLFAFLYSVLSFPYYNLYNLLFLLVFQLN